MCSSRSISKSPYSARCLSRSRSTVSGSMGVPSFFNLSNSSEPFVSLCTVCKWCCRKVLLHVQPSTGHCCYKQITLSWLSRFLWGLSLFPLDSCFRIIFVHLVDLNVVASDFNLPRTTTRAGRFLIVTHFHSFSPMHVAVIFFCWNTTARLYLCFLLGGSSSMISTALWPPSSPVFWAISPCSQGQFPWPFCGYFAVSRPCLFSILAGGNPDHQSPKNCSDRHR